MYITHKGCLYMIKRRHWFTGIRIKHFPELVVLLNIKVVDLHELLLLGLETALEEPLEGGLSVCPEEEAVAQSKVDGGHKEANGLHHIPT